MNEKDAQALKQLFDQVAVVSNFPEDVTWTRFTTEVWRDELAKEFDEDAYILTIDDVAGRQVSICSIAMLIQNLLAADRSKLTPESVAPWMFDDKPESKIPRTPDQWQERYAHECKRAIESGDLYKIELLSIIGRKFADTDWLPDNRLALDLLATNITDARNATIRKSVKTKWHELNHRLNGINESLTDLYGGPDIEESDDSTGLVRDRRIIGAQLKGLESAMTSAEFDAVYRPT